MQNHGIHKISLIINKNNISNVEKVEIALDNKNQTNNLVELEEIKEEISSLYEVSKDLIFIKLK